MLLNNGSENAILLSQLRIPWLEAWEKIKGILKETSMSPNELPDEYPWTDHLLNYVQELETELHNAGIDNKEYFTKRIRYCEELLEQKELLEDICENTRAAIGESYFELNEVGKSCDFMLAFLRDKNTSQLCRADYSLYGVSFRCYKYHSKFCFKLLFY